MRVKRALLFSKGQRGEKSMQFDPYIEMEHLYHYEFGFFYSEENIEVLVINHQTSHIRTLGNHHTQEEAELFLESCIQRGFQEKGMMFKAVPGYKLEKQVDSIRVQ